MAQAIFNIPMEENLKNQFDALCADCGLSPAAAINIFAETVVREKKLPFAPANISRENAMQAFALLRASARKNGLQDLPLAAINEEIQSSRSGQEQAK